MDCVGGLAFDFSHFNVSLCLIEEDTCWMFVFVLHRPMTVAVLLLMAGSLWLGFVAPRPLPVNPLAFFGVSDSSTVRFSQLSTYWLLIPAHILEAVYAALLAMQRNYAFPHVLAWFLQTLLVGFPSLSVLTAARKKKTRK